MIRGAAPERRYAILAEGRFADRCAFAADACTVTK